MSASWEDDEPGGAEFFAELGRLKRRAKARWLLTFLLTLVLTGLMVGRELRKQRKYPAKIVMSVEEVAVNEDVIPYTNGQFVGYVSSSVFTDARMLAIIEKHELHSMVKKQPELALESFREDVEVEAYRNLFLLYQPGKGDERSARLGITVWARDPELALEIARELGALVITHEAEQRRAQVEVAKIMSDAGVDQARADVDELEFEIAFVTQQIQDGGPGRLKFELMNLQESLKSAALALTAAENERADLELVGAHEAALGGLRFEIADWGHAAAPMPKWQRATITGVVLFLFLLPIMGIAVGAFDRRIYFPEDVARLGLRPLGRARAGTMPGA